MNKPYLPPDGRIAAMTTEQLMREFVGWLSADIPELHSVEIPRLADSLDRFHLAASPGPSPDLRAQIEALLRYDHQAYDEFGPEPDGDYVLRADVLALLTPAPASQGESK